PHLFPTIDSTTFAAVLEQGLGIERPGPVQPEEAIATDLTALTVLVKNAFFDSGSRRRVAIVFTDGESAPFTPSAVGDTLAARHVGLITVHVWQPDERIFELGGVDPGYRADPLSGRTLARLAATVPHGRALEEGDAAGIADAARALLGS